MILSKTKNRKSTHIDICLRNDVEAHSIRTGFGDVFLIHKAVPEISLSKVDTSITFLGHKLKAPLLIEAMTGGTDRAAKINANLAIAAEAHGLAMGVGSQRVALEDPEEEYTFRVAREKAPHAFLIGNLGASQIIGSPSFRDIRRSIEMIDADAFSIHLNPLQEAVQTEGDTSFEGVLKRIGEITAALQIPVIVKETGAGIAAEEAQCFETAGVKGIDVSGAGGTSWAAVESYRAKIAKDQFHQRLGNVFWDWGIPTTISIVEVKESTGLTVIASGGIRTGIEVAKALSLGADAVGLALPLLRPALEGNVDRALALLIEELKIAMFLSGADSVEKLQESSLVILGKTAEWLHTRGFAPEKYARRKKTP